MTTQTQERTVKIAEIYVTQRAKRSRNTVTKLYQSSGDTEWQAITNLIIQLDAKKAACTYFRKEDQSFCLYEGRKLDDILLTPSEPYKLESYEAIGLHDAFHKYNPAQ